MKTQNNFATFSDFDDILTEQVLRWLNDFQFKDRRFGFGGLNNKLFILSHLAITGYTVEKQQLFYLKHIDISKSNINWDYYLKHGRNGNLEHSITKKGYVPTSNDFKFTQQEIDSMETGSYEQIPVPVEDGE